MATGDTTERGTSETKAGHLRVGWASESLLPDRPVLLRGMPTARVAKDVHDPVGVTALALEGEDGERAIWVSADLCAIDDHTMATAREHLATRLPDFDPRLLIANATHTHTSLSGLSGIYPTPNEDCMTPEEAVDFMARAIAQAAEDAWEKRKPGAIAWGCGYAVVGQNRRIVYHSGESRMYGRTDDAEFSHVEGHEDYRVDLLYTYGEKRQLTGVVVNIACPAQCSAHMSSLSADFWHEARLAIGERLGEGVFVLPQCSAAGDQSPTLLVGAAAERRMLALREGVRPDDIDMPMARRREIGRRIAAAVEETATLVSGDIHERFPFVHRVVECELPMLRISAAQRDRAQEKLEEAQRKLAACDPERNWTEYSAPYREVYRYTRLLKRYESQGENPTQSVEVHVLKLGDVVFATNPFELFLDFGEQIKERSPAIQTFLVQLAGNGSYVPSDRAVAGGGYGAEPVSNPIGPEGGRALVEKTLEVIRSL